VIYSRQVWCKHYGNVNLATAAYFKELGFEFIIRNENVSVVHPRNSMDLFNELL